MIERTRTLAITGFLALGLSVLILAGCQSAVDSLIEPAALEAAPLVGTPEAKAPQSETEEIEMLEETEPPPATAESDSRGYQEGFTEQGEPFKGDPDAPVVIEEFSSYQCPYCARYFRESYSQILADHVKTGQVLYIFRDFPLGNQPQSPLAAEAAGCAGQVGGGSGFWAMHDRLFETQDEWSGRENAIAMFKGYAAELGLDADSFDACLDSGATRDQVQADASEGGARGVTGTPSFFINGQLLVGAQPYTVFAQAIDAALAGDTPVAAEPAAPAAGPTPAAIAPPEAAMTLGSPDAPVTIVEFSDYQCPFCARHYQETWPQIRSEFVDTGRVRYVFKDFPLTSIHPQADEAHETARCAGEQGAYWGMHDRLFARQSEWAGQANHVAIFQGYAAELKLDTQAFDACLESGRWTDAVNADLAEGVGLGVQGTPAFFIDGYPLYGAQPFDVFQYALELAEQGVLGEAYHSFFASFSPSR